MAKPKRTFTGQEGQRSTGAAGPDAIRRDFDAAFAMFDPNAILPDGDAGGIGAENMKPGAATDEVIGDRTINDSTTPSGDTGKLTTLLSNLANRIRAIMGTSSWRSGPPTTLQAAKDHIDAPAPHSGHETPAGAQAKVDAHANRRDNPHQVTAAQVGAITSVAGISNPGGGVDIVAGAAISITKDTTNKRIVINAHTEGAIPGPHASTHASGGSDPITPAMIGLGNVQNYGIATQAEAEAGTANNKYMTPLRVAQAIAALHANRQDNPHNVQAQQVPYSSGVSGFTPSTVKAALDALAGVRIVEMGSNANGEYVRWENGLQVCFRSVVLNFVAGGGQVLTSGTRLWPAQFSARPFVTAPTYETIYQYPFEDVMNADIKNVYYSRLSSADFEIRMYQDGSGSFQDGDSIDVFVIAIGRWK